MVRGRRTRFPHPIDAPPHFAISLFRRHLVLCTSPQSRKISAYHQRRPSFTSHKRLAVVAFTAQHSAKEHTRTVDPVILSPAARGLRVCQNFSGVFFDNNPLTSPLLSVGARVSGRARYRRPIYNADDCGCRARSQGTCTRSEVEGPHWNGHD
jgi:hypothetical protein